MKTIVALCFMACLPALSHAAPSCQLGQESYPAGASAIFYLVEESAKIGPAYTCQELSRVRSCEVSRLTGETRWSESQPECGSFDSGGCVDRWLDQLPDSAFAYPSCR